MKSYLRLLWGIALLGCCACTTSQDRTTLLEVSPRSVVLPHEGGDEWIELQADGAWTSEVSPPIAREWLTTEPASGGSRETSGPAARRTERGFRTRDASVHFDASELSQVVAVTQAPTLVTPGRLELPALNTTEYLTVGSASEPLEVAPLPAGGVVYGRGRGARRHPGLDESRRGKVRDVAVTAGRFTQDVVLVQRAFDPVRNYGDSEVVALQRATSETACVWSSWGRLYACRDGPGNRESMKPTCGERSKPSSRSILTAPTAPFRCLHADCDFRGGGHELCLSVGDPWIRNSRRCGRGVSTSISMR